jgi:hypothetical protein
MPASISVDKGDHRLVEDREQLLGDHKCCRIEARPGAAREDNALHSAPQTVWRLLQRALSCRMGKFVKNSQSHGGLFGSK